MKAKRKEKLPDQMVRATISILMLGDFFLKSFIKYVFLIQQIVITVQCLHYRGYHTEILMAPVKFLFLFCMIELQHCLAICLAQSLFWSSRALVCVGLIFRQARPIFSDNHSPR